MYFGKLWLRKFHAWIGLVLAWVTAGGHGWAVFNVLYTNPMQAFMQFKKVAAAMRCTSPAHTMLPMGLTRPVCVDVLFSIAHNFIPTKPCSFLSMLLDSQLAMLNLKLGRFDEFPVAISCHS